MNIKAQRLTIAAALTATLCAATPAVHAEDGHAIAEDVVTKVWGAARFLQTKGASGIAALNNADGPWVWKDSYVFAFDCRLDRMVAHPMRPDLVGRPIMQIQDNNGKYVFKALCEAAESKHGGWVDYMWTKPGAGAVSRKLTYAVTAEMAFSTGLQIAAGVYDDTLTVQSLDAMTEKMADPGRLAH